ncbi:DEAD-domain-containing protein [Gymnopus androsaceus JB14]|uniref:ATP-dependent RNA helicase n=1 Tax=Gymnopus androsaceus JB14 TaxID=1447944 RepID=A0A6A4GZ60_9AGAR|nr:DEAD-domain-containing protein [Gymnopus androsaceus JB14]
MSSSLLTRAFKASSTIRAAGTLLSLKKYIRLYRFQSTAAAINPASDTAAETPLRRFDTLQGVVSENTFKAIVGQPLKLETMTSVQEEVLSLLPAISQPHNPESPNVRDLLVRAKTGTGKTLTFLVPAIEARAKAIENAGKKALIDAGLNNNSALEMRARDKFARETVGALIISPTRELATQIANEAVRLLHHHKMEVRLFTGGTSKRLQMRDWMKGTRDISHLLESEPEVLKGITTTSTFILDEADTMLEMGFRDDIAAIQKVLKPSPQRQTLLFSATVSPVIRQVAQATLAKEYKYIDCVKSDESPVHAHVPQYHTILPNASSQIPHILRLIAHDQLTNPGRSKVMLFLPTTKMTQLYATVLRELSRHVLPVATNIHEIHSKRTMDSRTNASDRFRKDKSPGSVLVTSDVSARGVDYPGVTRVIQVGIPGSTDQYIHLVGRGDLVLLPWEIGFITWQLTEVPIKPVTSAEIKLQLEELAKEADARKDLRKPMVPRLDEFEIAPANLMNRFDEEAIRETFMSLLGYYFAKSPELRVQKPIILEGCKDWAVKACGLATPPYVSEQFLLKLGMSDNRTGSSYGKPRRERSYEPDYNPKSHWMGRGSIQKKEERRSRANSWSVNNDGDERSAGASARDDGEQGYGRGYEKSGGYGGGQRSGGYGGRERSGYGGSQRNGGTEGVREMRGTEGVRGVGGTEEARRVGLIVTEEDRRMMGLKRERGDSEVVVKEQGLGCGKRRL